jgi:hypothetical protein
MLVLPKERALYPQDGGRDSLAQAHVEILFDVGLDAWADEVTRFQVRVRWVTARFGKSPGQFDSPNLDHHRKNGGVKCAEHETIQGQGEDRKSTKFTETPDMAAGPHEENGDLERIIPEDSISNLIDSLEHNVTSKLHLATPFTFLDCGAGYVRMREYRTCQTKGLVEANGTDQEGEGFNKANRVEGNVEVHGQGKSKEEGSDRRWEDCCHEPEVGAEATRWQEQASEGYMHQDISQENKKDVKRIGFLGQIPETNDESLDSITNPTTALLYYVSITTLDVILDIELIVESGGPPVQRVDEVLAGTGSKRQGQYVWSGGIGYGMGETLGRLVRCEAEANRVVSVIGV